MTHGSATSASGAGTAENPDWSGPLDAAHRQAEAYLDGLATRPVGARAGLDELREALGGPLPEKPADARDVVDQLAAAAQPGLVATPSGRFFGFVVGGALPAALAADWLTAAWDQNAGIHALSPAAAVVEQVAAGWLTELFGLPAGVSYGFVTGAQMAHVTALAAARHEVLRRVGWDVETDGLMGAPRIRVLCGRDRHDTVDRALRFLGLGTACIDAVDTDSQGRMRPASLARQLNAPGPVIVCAQAGNVNTGAVDPLDEICQLSGDAGAWVHVDGAFGLWAAASPRLRHLVTGVELADSWATDAHKWLNVPYDSGLVFCAHPAAHRAAMGVRAGYLIHGAGDERDEVDFNPEFSRRARGFAVYAAIRSLGRTGIVDMIDRCCDLAHRFADQLSRQDDIDVLNDVVLNQVLVRFRSGNGQHDAHTRTVVERVQRDGVCWMSGTTWRGLAAMRISVSNWSSDESDVDRAVDAILRCRRA